MVTVIASQGNVLKTMILVKTIWLDMVNLHTQGDMFVGSAKHRIEGHSTIKTPEILID